MTTSGMHRRPFEGRHLVRMRAKLCLSLYSSFFPTRLTFFWLLFENRPALYFCNWKENKKNNTRMLDTLFIGDFMDSMEEYFHF